MAGVIHVIATSPLSQTVAQGAELVANVMDHQHQVISSPQGKKWSNPWVITNGDATCATKKRGSLWLRQDFNETWESTRTMGWSTTSATTSPSVAVINLFVAGWEGLSWEVPSFHDLSSLSELFSHGTVRKSRPILRQTQVFSRWSL